MLKQASMHCHVKQKLINVFIITTELNRLLLLSLPVLVSRCSQTVCGLYEHVYTNWLGSNQYTCKHFKTWKTRMQHKNDNFMVIVSYTTLFS